jgi:uncharacterized protein with GYD domain
MPKYLFEVKYTVDGIRGVAQEGGTGRIAAARQAAESLGGAVEAMYWAFGDTDAYVIIDLPDNEAATALAVTVASSGTMTVRTTVLITPEEMDAAVRREMAYRPPGS